MITGLGSLGQLGHMNGKSFFFLVVDPLGFVIFFFSFSFLLFSFFSPVVSLFVWGTLCLFWMVPGMVKLLKFESQR